jgi:hypothetical protein
MLQLLLLDKRQRQRWRHHPSRRCLCVAAAAAYAETQPKNQRLHRHGRRSEIGRGVQGAELALRSEPSGGAQEVDGGRHGEGVEGLAGCRQTLLLVSFRWTSVGARHLKTSRPSLGTAAARRTPVRQCSFLLRCSALCSSCPDLAAPQRLHQASIQERKNGG